MNTGTEAPAADKIFTWHYPKSENKPLRELINFTVSPCILIH